MNNAATSSAEAAHEKINDTPSYLFNHAYRLNPEQHHTKNLSSSHLYSSRSHKLIIKLRNILKMSHLD